MKCDCPDERRLRKPTWNEGNPDGRWRSDSYEDFLKRNKVTLDIFWLKDQGLEDSENLPDPDVLAREIADDLQTPLDQFLSIAADMRD